MYMIIVLQEHSQGASTSNWPSVPGSQVTGHLPGSYDKSRFLNLYAKEMLRLPTNYDGRLWRPFFFTELSQPARRVRFSW